MIDKMLVTVIAVGLAVVITLQLLLLGLPMFRRLEFDAICHRYTMLIDHNGGLNAELETRLRQDLVSRGFAVSRLSGTRDARFGSALDLYVSATFPSQRLGADMSVEEVRLSVIYQSSTLCRVLRALAAAPSDICWPGSWLWR